MNHVESGQTLIQYGHVVSLQMIRENAKVLNHRAETCPRFIYDQRPVVCICAVARPRRCQTFRIMFLVSLGRF